MICNKCKNKMDCLDDCLIGPLHYEAYYCFDCDLLIEKINGQIIGKECEVIFYPDRGGDDDSGF